MLRATLTHRHSLLMLTALIGLHWSAPAPAAESALLKDPAALDSAEKWREKFGVKPATPGTYTGKTRSVVIESAAPHKTAATTPATDTVATQKVDVQINFKLNSATVTPEWQPPLSSLATLLKEDPGLNLAIEGHTDARGSAQYNQVLSRKRANAVREFLVKTTPEAEARLSAVGHGSDMPFNKQDPYDAANRRVSFTIVKR